MNQNRDDSNPGRNPRLNTRQHYQHLCDALAVEAELSYAEQQRKKKHARGKPHLAGVAISVPTRL